MDFQKQMQKRLVYKAFVKFAKQYPMEAYLLNRDMYMKHILDQFDEPDPALLDEIETKMLEDIMLLVEAESASDPEEWEDF